MNDRVLPQLLGILRATPLTFGAQLEFALQAVAWAKLSQGTRLPEALRLTGKLVADQESLSGAFDGLSTMDGIIGQAFVRMSSLDLGTPSTRAVLELALQLAETGVLEHLDPSDAINLHPSKQAFGWSLPAEIASLLVDLAELEQGESVYIPWDFGAQLASRAAAKGAKVHLESTIRSPIPALVSLIADRLFEIQFGEPIRDPSFIAEGRARKFDVAVAFPPLGQRYNPDVVDRDWFGRFPERTTSGTALAVRHLLSQASRRIVVAVPNNFTFGMGAESSIRDDLLKRGMVRSVIAMPAGLLESSGLAFTILILEPAGGNHEVQFINADDKEFLTRTSKARATLTNQDFLVRLVKKRAASKFSENIPEDYVLGRGGELQVSSYLLSASALDLELRLAGLPKVCLGDVVDTIRPIATSKDGAGEEVGEIGAADLPPHGYISSPSRTVRVEITDKNQRNFLLPLDIVLVVKGSAGKVGIVPENVPPPGPGGWVAGQSAIVLRPSNDRVDPRALALQLRSALGQKLLAQLVKGATIPLIQLRELMQLAVLLPDRETTAAAVAALEMEEELQKQVEALQAKLSVVAADLWPVA